MVLQSIEIRTQKLSICFRYFKLCSTEVEYYTEANFFPGESCPFGGGWVSMALDALSEFKKTNYIPYTLLTDKGKQVTRPYLLSSALERI